MKKILTILLIAISSLSYSQGALVIDTKMEISSVQIKHMEENQYNQMSVENIDSNYIVVYYEEYQAYNLVVNQDYFLTIKISSSYQPTLENTQIICSCNYKYVTVGDKNVLSITF